MIQELRQLLSECHLKSGQVPKMLEKADWSYTLQRAEEELEKAGEATKDGMFKLADAKIKFAIQLLNVTRFKMQSEVQFEPTQNQGQAGAGG